MKAERGRRSRPVLWLGRVALALCALLLFAELALQLASLIVRDRSGPGWRPGTRVRVLALGDSHTYGGTVRPDETYPAQLQRFLDEARPGVYSVLNLGIPGLNTPQLRRRFAVNLARWDPDDVVVWCGANNAWNAAGRTGGGLARRIDAIALHLKLYKLARVLWNDRTLAFEAEKLLSAQRHEPEPIDLRTYRAPLFGQVRIEERSEEKVDRDALDEATSDFAAMVRMAHAAGARILLITYPLDFDRFRVANEAARRVARELGAEVVEGKAGHERVPGEENRYTWALHPSAPVYREIARDVAARLLAPADADTGHR